MFLDIIHPVISQMSFKEKAKCWITFENRITVAIYRHHKCLDLVYKPSVLAYISDVIGKNNQNP
jgi:hypothetical protein